MLLLHRKEIYSTFTFTHWFIQDNFQVNILAACLFLCQTCDLDIVDLALHCAGLQARGWASYSLMRSSQYCSFSLAL